MTNNASTAAEYSVTEIRKNRQRKKQYKMLRRSLAHAVVIIFCGIFVIPFIWMVLTSFKSQQEIYANPPTIFPNILYFQNYVDVFSKIPYLRYVINTLTISLSAVIGQIISSTMVAYSMSKINWFGKKYFFPIIIATMMIPYQVTMIPLYMIYKNLGFTGTYLPLILPNFFGSAYYIFLLRQFFMTIPNSLTEAATIDGAGETRIFVQIILPLCKPAITTVAIFTFMGNWSDFMGPLLYLNKEEMYTISIGLQAFVQSHFIEWGLLLAASTIFTIPIILLFFFAQRYFIEGITITGIKG